MKVAPTVFLMGWSGLLPSFFATVAARLEPQGAGSRFPMLAELATGELPPEHARALRQELETIDREIGALSIGDVEGATSGDVAWLREGRFTTLRGSDVIRTLVEAAADSVEGHEPMRVYSDFLKRI